jgi:hypothetical protein
LCTCGGELEDVGGDVRCQYVSGGTYALGRRDRLSSATRSHIEHASAGAEIRSYCIELVWEQSALLPPEKEANNPPGCHRSRIPGWIVFEKLLQVFGCAYWRIADEECLDTTLRRRRDE